MQHKPTLKQYSQGNNTLTLHSTLAPLKITATSYDWYHYLLTDSVGNVVLSDYYYSVSTNKHIRDSLAILSNRYYIEPNLTLSRVREDMHRHAYNTDDAIKYHITLECHAIREDITSLIREIKNKGSWSKTNAIRKERVTSLLYRIKDLRNYRDNFIGKRLILRSPNNYNRSHTLDVESLKKLFSKPNGKYDELAVNTILKRDAMTFRLGDHLRPPNSYTLENTLNLFKTYLDIPMSRENKITLLSYIYLVDTATMLPRALLNEDHIKLKRWAKRMIADLKAITLWDLECLHTYLINKQNRATYVPQVDQYLPLPDKLLSLETKHAKHLRLIKSVSQLRREGKEQSHCIGSRSYIDACLQGNIALRYKDYTFYLNKDLKVLQTNGKYNAYTPEAVHDELMKILGD